MSDEQKQHSSYIAKWETKLEAIVDLLEDALDDTSKDAYEAGKREGYTAGKADGKLEGCEAGYDACLAITGADEDRLDTMVVPFHNTPYEADIGLNEPVQRRGYHVYVGKED